MSNYEKETVTIPFDIEIEGMVVTITKVTETTFGLSIDYDIEKKHDSEENMEKVNSFLTEVFSPEALKQFMEAYDKDDTD